MDDDKQYTIQIKGTAYRFRPVPTEDLSMMIMVLNMGASQTKTLKALSRVVSNSAGAEQWDALTDRLIAGEVAIEEITVDVVKRLVARQNKDAARKTAPAPATDAE